MKTIANVMREIGAVRDEKLSDGKRTFTVQSIQDGSLYLQDEKGVTLAPYWCDILVLPGLHRPERMYDVCQYAYRDGCATCISTRYFMNDEDAARHLGTNQVSRLGFACRRVCQSEMSDNGTYEP